MAPGRAPIRTTTVALRVRGRVDYRGRAADLRTPSPSCRTWCSTTRSGVALQRKLGATAALEAGVFISRHTTVAPQGELVHSRRRHELGCSTGCTLVREDKLYARSARAWQASRSGARALENTAAAARCGYWRAIIVLARLSTRHRVLTACRLERMARRSGSSSLVSAFADSRMLAGPLHVGKPFAAKRPTIARSRSFCAR